MDDETREARVIDEGTLLRRALRLFRDFVAKGLDAPRDEVDLLRDDVRSLGKDRVNQFRQTVGKAGLDGKLAFKGQDTGPFVMGWLFRPTDSAVYGAVVTLSRALGVVMRYFSVSAMLFLWQKAEEFLSSGNGNTETWSAFSRLGRFLGDVGDHSIQFALSEPERNRKAAAEERMQREVQGVFLREATAQELEAERVNSLSRRDATWEEIRSTVPALLEQVAHLKSEIVRRKAVVKEELEGWESARASYAEDLRDAEDQLRLEENALSAELRQPRRDADAIRWHRRQVRTASRHVEGLRAKLQSANEQIEKRQRWVRDPEHRLADTRERIVHHSVLAAEVVRLHELAGGEECA